MTKTKDTSRTLASSAKVVVQPNTHLALFSNTVSQFQALTESRKAAAVGAKPSVTKAAVNGVCEEREQQRRSLLLFVFPQSVIAYLRSVHLAQDVASSSDLSSEDVLSKLLPAFVSDNDFLLAKEQYFCMVHWGSHACNMNIPTTLHKQVQDAGLLLLDCMDCLATCTDEFALHIRVRLAKMTIPPRIVRVSQQLDLTPGEFDAMMYILVCHCGSSAVFNTSNSLIPSVVARFAKLEPRQLLHFLSEHRLHIKQGLVSTDTKFKTSFVDSRLGIAIEAAAAFTGEDLSEEQLIKLEKTVLANVLLAEKSGSGSGGSPIAVVAGGGDGASPTSNSSKPPKKRQAAGDHEDDEEGEESEEEDEEGDDGDDDDAADDGPSTTAAATQRKRPREDDTHASPLAAPSLPAPPTAANVAAAALTAASTAASSRFSEPYSSDIEYMDDAFKLIANIVKLRNAEGDMKDDEETFYNVPKNKVEATMRELKGRHRVATAMMRTRLDATRKAAADAAAAAASSSTSGGFLPRIEALSDKLGLCEFEKQILLLLVGNVVSHDIVIAINGRYAMREGLREITVGYLLFILCDTLQERVQSRKCFYQSGALISNSIISTSLPITTRTCFNTDLMDYMVDIDRKIVDYLMGTEVETAEMLPGSKLYVPTVPISNVVLPQDTTNLVLSTIEHYSLLLKCTEKCGFGKELGCGSTGLVFLFHGPSGTGKTMLANAVAHDLKKKILLVNLLQFKSDAKSPEILRFVFREAKLNDAIIFFDECETFFETRESNPLVTSLLAEFEKYDGMIILATNRAQVIDEAMNRRISLIIEFKLPSHQMREKIWRSHMPTGLAVHEDVSFEGIALDYELSGGLIRNATLAAISHAVAREKSDTPTVRMEDIVHGAKQQLRGFFQASEKLNSATQAYVTPRRGLDELVVDHATRAQLEAIAKLSKSRNMLFSQWGFSEHECVDQSVICLFYGPSGTGKSLSVEGIAYECGATLRVCNIGELFMMHDISIVSVFEEGRKLNALIVFDQAELLFDHSEKSRSVAQLIQYHALVYPRPVMLLATTGSGLSTTTNTIDIQAAHLQLTHEVQFQLPNRPLRKELWRRSFPSKVPLAPDVDFDVLSEQMLSAKAIRSICFNACCKVALQSHAAATAATSTRASSGSASSPLVKAAVVVTLKAIMEEKEETLARERRRSYHSSMFV